MSSINPIFGEYTRVWGQSPGLVTSAVTAFTQGGQVALSQQDNVTAQGSKQSDAYTIAAQATRFTVCAAGAGGRLPGTTGTGGAGSWFIICNDAPNVGLTVYPAYGEQIDNQGINVPVVVAPGTITWFQAFTPGFLRTVAAGTTANTGQFSSEINVTLSTTQNNYNPTNWTLGVTRINALAASGGSTVTGLSGTGAPIGKPIYWWNSSPTDVTMFVNNSNLSSVGNRFLCDPSGIVLGAQDGMILILSASLNAWTLS